MPEGNEIHRYAVQHAEMLQGRTVDVAAPNGRFETGATQLNRRKLWAVDAYGKHLFYDFGKGRQLHVHLGMYGKFRSGQMPFPEPIGALRLRISTREHWIELRGPTACEVVSESSRETLLKRIGPDPLRTDADAAITTERIRASRAPIGALLMDQSVVAGIGNILRAELLFRAELSPFRAGRTIPKKALLQLWHDAKLLLEEGMVDRRLVTTRPQDRPHPKGKARRFETHYVYRRQNLPCFVCGTEIMTKEFIGRNLFWCPYCQPESSDVA